MKFFSKTFLFCFFVGLSLEFLDSICAAKFRRNGNDSGALGGNVRDIRSFDAMLLSERNEHGTQFGEDVILSGYGSINLTLTYEILEFEVCKSCMGTSTVCYEASIGLGDSKAVGDCRGSSCELKVNGIDNKIFFGRDRVFKFRFVYYCDSTTKMQYPFANFLSGAYFESCEPKIDDDKMIKLFVNINPECTIKVKNARIYVPKVTESKVLPPPKSPSKDSSEASFPIWGYIIIIVGIIVLIVILIIGFIAYHLYKTHKPSKYIPPNVDEIKSKPTVSNANVAIVETRTNQKLKLAKVEPNMNNETTITTTKSGCLFA
uniref:Transmembrane protein n=1 Tax=Panagrolaimus davidi TaxID=227884 RepID=A0A914QPK2_9BILA